MAELLEAKGITTFAALRDEKAENDAQRYRLRVIASDVTQRKLLVLPDDAPGLGLDPDELEIAYAVRMSTSIPIFFEPVIHRNPATGDDHVIVDGGMLSNFPVWLFDRRDGTPRWPTFGLRLVEPDPRISIADRLPGPEPGAGGSLIDYVKSLAATMMEAHDRLYLENASFARTIAIPTLGVRSMDFDITPERVRALYRSGHEAASRFLDDWDFPAYVEQFRRGTVTSRRAQLHAQRPAG